MFLREPCRFLAKCTVFIIVGALTSFGEPDLPPGSGSKTLGYNQAMQNVIVIGGGISGLSFAYRCATEGSGALVLETSPRLGGCLHSQHLETGFWFELGPGFILSIIIL